MMNSKRLRKMVQSCNEPKRINVLSRSHQNWSAANKFRESLCKSQASKRKTLKIVRLGLTYIRESSTWKRSRLATPNAKSSKRREVVSHKCVWIQGSKLRLINECFTEKFKKLSVKVTSRKLLSLGWVLDTKLQIAANQLLPKVDLLVNSSLEMPVPICKTLLYLAIEVEILGKIAQETCIQR